MFCLHWTWHVVHLPIWSPMANVSTGLCTRNIYHDMITLSFIMAWFSPYKGNETALFHEYVLKWSAIYLRIQCRTFEPLLNLIQYYYQLNSIPLTTSISLYLHTMTGFIVTHGPDVLSSTSISSPKAFWLRPNCSWCVSTAFLNSSVERGVTVVDVEALCPSSATSLTFRPSSSLEPGCGGDDRWVPLTWPWGTLRPPRFFVLGPMHSDECLGVMASLSSPAPPSLFEEEPMHSLECLGVMSKLTCSPPPSPFPLEPTPWCTWVFRVGVKVPHG